MTKTRLGKEIVTIIRAPLKVDPRDNSKWRDWNDTTETTYEGCMVEPFPLAEKLNFEENREREYAQSSVRVYVPVPADIIHTDRFRWNGEEYRILGHPGLWKKLDGSSHHYAIVGQLRKG